MASTWSVIAYYALPLPLILFALLALPLPKAVRKGCVLFIARVFDLSLIGRFKLLHVALWLTGAAFLSSWRQVWLIRQAQGGTGAYVTPNMEIGVLSKRWRAERNSWMSGFAFTIWLALAAYYREARCRLAAEDRLAEIEQMMSDGKSEITTTRDDREASVAREVSSRLGQPAGGSPMRQSPVKANASTPTARPTAAAAVIELPVASASELKKEL